MYNVFFLTKRLVGIMLISFVLILGACANTSSNNQSDNNTNDPKKRIEIAFRDFGSGNTGLKEWLEGVKTEFEQQHPGVKVQFVPIQASEGDFFAKLALMVKNSQTAPDIVTEDTFMINSDAAAGNIDSLDKYVNQWDDWNNFNSRVKQGVTATDGKVYGVPYSTDTRGLWYNVNIFNKAGLPVPWNPKDWNDILEAAKTIKEKVQGVIPFWANSGKATGEATSMQTFEMLLYGTEDTLYNFDSKKWVVKSQGFLDSLKFIHEIYSNGLGPQLSQVLTGKAGDIVQMELMPKEKVGIVLNGNWVPGVWREEGPLPWKEGTKIYKLAAMPTQNGQPPGFTSMSGGWALSIPSKADNKELAWEFIKLATSKKHNKVYVLKQGDLTPRTDVAQDPEVLNAPGSVTKEAASFIKFTHFRPGVDKYPAVSTAIQAAVEAVATGSLSPEEAMNQYAREVTRIVGAENVEVKEYKK
ncbi:extracellular solute-binding protein [Parageobacillus sp. VR-IP]|uniref:extracellular solute-binding protein n=1 Tax=Parageobacillus sp. VR-IP TaxID=2742205 RepID=UPI00158308B8|nr:extracellular solute-binding protein [Parageobacillus sp. VR-IP]NUK30202.1 extracellular solute-binding protein [Parageobacillus sp. VR-IP]